MIDWDDIRYFLAIARAGSVRAGAEHLSVNHSTVLRRISLLEERLGARMFDRLPAGYRLTDAGKDVLEFAEQMAAASNRLETRIFGRDQGAGGLLRVTMTSMLATHLFMPDFAEFARLNLNIELEILARDELINLTNREADVAIRVVYEQSALPLNLHGLKGPEVFGAVYLSKAILAEWRQRAPLSSRWVLKEFEGIPAWVGGGDFPIGGVPFRTPDATTHIAAVRAGIGLTALPCFVGDADPLLIRAPGTSLHSYGSLWLLTQGETRKTKRVQLFTDFISQRLGGYADLLAGRCPRCDGLDTL